MKFKGTKGRATISKDEFDVLVDGCSVATTSISMVLKENESTDFANTKLIADAFNTVTECDLLPSELLEQRNELLKIAQKIKNLEALIRYPEDVKPSHEDEARAIHELLNDVDLAIKKALN